MQINGILSVFIGLALTFGTISLVVSASTEAIASACALRSKMLLDGVGRLLNDTQVKGLALDVMNHGAANPLAPGTAQSRAELASAPLPSYIPPAHFATALIDSISKQTGTRAGTTGAPSLPQSLEAVADPQLRGVLLGFYQRAGGDLAAFHQHIATWFGSSMDRLSGEYKRRTQLISFLVALALILSMNIDAWTIAVALWTHPDIAAHVAPNLNLNAPDAYMAVFKNWVVSFPFGWGTSSWAPPDILRHFAGCLLTAVATLFGAPFWFDTMRRFVQLRGTGPAPGPSGK
jgi:hypothetical protein